MSRLYEKGSARARNKANDFMIAEAACARIDREGCRGSMGKTNIPPTTIIKINHNNNSNSNSNDNNDND